MVLGAGDRGKTEELNAFNTHHPPLPVSVLLDLQEDLAGLNCSCRPFLPVIVLTSNRNEEIAFSQADFFISQRKIMWRHAVRLAQRHPRRLARPDVLAAILSSSRWPETSTNISMRSFSRRVRGGLDDPDDELNEHKASEAERRLTKTPSATDMEFFSQLADDLEDDEDDDEKIDAEYQRKQEEIRRELDSRTGRGWTDPWHISEEQWMSLQTYDDLPEWSPEFVSRISQERVKVYSEGIPILSVLASMSLPPEACPHPGLGKTKEYAAYRKEVHYRHIAQKAQELAKPKVERILKLKTWEEKQDAVDELFESVEEQLRNQEEILGLHPEFPNWVGMALEEYLTDFKVGESKDSVKKSDAASKDAEAEPLFMDCFDPNEPDEIVPTILSPLRPHPRDGPGRMVEEWQLSANKKTKRILMRACTRKVAEALEKNDVSRVFVHGRRGVGKVPNLMLLQNCISPTHSSIVVRF